MTEWPPMVRRGPSVSEHDILAFEKRFGWRLPQDYRRFLLDVNGGRTAQSHREFSGGILNTLLSLNDTTDESRDLATRVEWARRSLPSAELLLIGADDGGASITIALDVEHCGEVWLHVPEHRPAESNPRALWHDRRDMHKLANSFQDFIGSLRPLRKH